MRTKLFKAVVSLSGGMDSATVLGRTLGQYNPGQVLAVSFSYRSKHNPYEVKASRALAEFYGVDWLGVDLSLPFAHVESNLLEGGGDIPEGHYEDRSMAKTVVPGRNMIFASVMAGIAWSHQATDAVLGIHAGDHAIYPDCRPPFFISMREAIWQGTDKRVTLIAPFLYDSKADILRYGLAYVPSVPYQLTRTCYQDQPMACGRCGACQERLASFAANGATDPIEYESREIMPKGE